jgi:hypothetical protein
MDPSDAAGSKRRGAKSPRHGSTSHRDPCSSSAAIADVAARIAAVVSTVRLAQGLSLAIRGLRRATLMRADAASKCCIGPVDPPD